MQAVERLSSYITQGVYTVSGPFHPFGGAVDIIVVEQQDGSFKSSPWYVRFGKFLGVLKTREMVVKIFVNGTEAGFHMCLDNKGEAFFLRECDSESEDVGFSPMSSGDETEEGSGSARSMKNHMESCETESISKIDVENGKIVGRTDSRRSTILGFVFGRKPAKEEDEGNENMPRSNSLERAEIAADLLETKWSTNLPVSSLTFGKSKKVAEEACKDADSREEAASSSNAAEGDLSMAVNGHEEHFGETKVEFSPSFTTHGEVLEVYSSENGDLINRHEIFSDIPSEVDIPHLETSFQDSTMIAERIVDIQSSEFALLSQNNKGLSEELGDSLTRGDFMDECRGREKASYIFYETIQSSTVTFDVAGDKVELATPLGRTDKVEYDGEILVNSIELASNVEPILTREASVKEEDATKKTSNHGEGPHEDTSSHVLTTAGSSLGYTHQDIGEEEAHAFEKLEDCKPAILENTLQSDETQADTCKPEVLKFKVDQNVIFNVDEEIIDIHALGSSAHSGSQEQETQFSKAKETGAHHPSCEVSATGGHGIHETSNHDETATPRSLLLSASEDEHVLFSDVDNYAVGEISPQFTIDEEAGSEEHIFLEPEESTMEHELYDINGDQSPKDLQDSPTTPTSAIKIPIRRNPLEESDRLCRSLPNVPSQIHHLDMSDSGHPLSSSVQLNSQKFGIYVLEEGSPTTSKFEEGSTSEKVQEEPSPKNAMEQLNGCESSSTSPSKEKAVVEISLCKHLLFEGMGVEAAAKAFESEKVDLESFAASGPSIVKNGKLIVRIGARYYPWNVAAPIILGLVTFDKDQIFESKGIKVEKPPANSGGPWGIWPFRFNKSKSMKLEQKPADESKEDKTPTISGDASSTANDKPEPEPEPEPRRVKRREHFITPSPEQLASLNLNEGRNSVTFTFESAMLGKQQVDARIYLWKWSTRIVISDVDGTITKSDVLGQFMPLVGKDWSQTGVAHLFSSIKDNGYEFIFLSARAIAQAYLTRQFLFNLKQDGKSLPDGPVVISPDGLFPSLYREVIRRAPHEFKIACLEEIRALFPPDCNPFYAGFGNRHTDEISYLKVGIPKGKIFIINPRGQVAVNNLVDTRSYTSLNSLVNGMFPPATAVEQEEFNNWNFWRLPLPDVDG